MKWTTKVCLDETRKQLTKEVPTLLSAKPARVDSEYERNGTANLFMESSLSAAGGM